jgi:hypothetical protein
MAGDKGCEVVGVGGVRKDFVAKIILVKCQDKNGGPSFWIL